MDVRNIIDKLGGTRSAARLLNTEPPTVSNWIRRGIIPARWHQIIIEAAFQNDIDITPKNFFDEKPMKKNTISDLRPFP